MHEIEHENATRSTSLLRIGGSCPVEVDGGHAWVLLGARPRADYRTKRTGPRSSKGVFVGDARLAFPADVFGLRNDDARVGAGQREETVRLEAADDRAPASRRPEDDREGRPDALRPNDTVACKRRPGRDSEEGDRGRGAPRNGDQDERDCH